MHSLTEFTRRLEHALKWHTVRVSVTDAEASPLHQTSGILFLASLMMWPGPWSGFRGCTARPHHLGDQWNKIFAPTNSMPVNALVEQNLHCNSHEASTIRLSFPINAWYLKPAEANLAPRVGNVLHCLIHWRLSILFEREFTVELVNLTPVSSLINSTNLDPEWHMAHPAVIQSTFRSWPIGLPFESSCRVRVPVSYAFHVFVSGPNTSPYDRKAAIKTNLWQNALCLRHSWSCRDHFSRKLCNGVLINWIFER